MTGSRTTESGARRRNRRRSAARSAQLALRPAPDAVPSPISSFESASIASHNRDEIDELPPAHPVFAHASEAEMARILDFYRVRWAYEPHTFPILWNLDGNVVESFSPDFWLPDLDLYLEMTTLRQKLVRKKNRKLRRILELYPDIRVKLFYARDFRALMLKFGRLALVDELSGASGQVVPDRGPGGEIAVEGPGDPASAISVADLDIDPGDGP